MGYNISCLERHGGMAQLVEHIVHIDGVTGSSPVVTTKKNGYPLRVSILFAYAHQEPACDLQRCELTSMGGRGEWQPGGLFAVGENEPSAC